MQFEADTGAAGQRLRDESPGTRQRQRRRLATIEVFAERIGIVEPFRPNMLRKRLRQRADGYLPARMTAGDPRGAPDYLHGVADETVGTVVHAESQIEIGQRGHLVFWKLLLHCTEEGPVCCPVFFQLPLEGAYPQGRAESAPELFILAQHLQTTLQPGHHDREPGLFNLLLQPIGNVVDNAGPLDVHEVLELVKRKEPHPAALDQFAQANALADRVAPGPQWIAELEEERLRETLDGRPCGDFRDQHRNFDAPPVINTGVEAGEIRDDRGLSAAAFANQGAAIRLGRSVMAVEARLYPRDRRFEERILDQNPFGTIH